MSEFFAQIVSVFSATWFIVMPVLFWFVFKSLWGRHVYIADFLMKQNEVMLEIIPPREIEKSPKVMERFFDSLAATDAGTSVFNQYCHGAGNPFFSLEIVGTEGMAHFYIRTPAALRDFVESSLYAQYPDVEIVEAGDYTYQIPNVIPNEEWTLKGFDLALLKSDAYPIKTYQYFEEDVTGKMIDPLASMLEAIGNLGPGQHMWLQYVIRADRPPWFDEWGQSTVEEFVGRATKPQSVWARVWFDIKDVFGGVAVGWDHPPEFSELEEPKTNDQPVEFRLTPGEKQTLKALEENISKLMFSVNMRLIVVGQKDFFTPVNLAGAMSSIKQFSDNHTNQFVPVDRSKVYADYVNVESRMAYRMRKMLTRYRDRDDTGYPFHLSSAELATVFHLPDMSVESPSVQWSDSRRGSAPSNLPFE
ncbi:MAG: hypothetical protein U9Q12_01540 [Patescibacteria group bacterium]|nr:hypothetical protein [Patescibacteria group bacterium]